jgi:endonuclease YncB( thermonuclease family)
MLEQFPYVRTNPDWVYNAVVARWVDGDTIDLDVIVRLDLGFHYYQTNHFKLRFRLNGINTPERGEVNWAEATAFCNEAFPPGTVLTIKTYKMPTSYISTGTLGRYVAELWHGDDNVNQVIVASGFAEEIKGSDSMSAKMHR